jgi:hypothetical protein
VIFETFVFFVVPEFARFVVHNAPVTRDHISRAGWRIVLLASLGGTLEFYDFVIFGVFAKDIADAIFPNSTPLVSLIASFATFAVGYLARPIGGGSPTSPMCGRPRAGSMSRPSSTCSRAEWSAGR